MANRFRGELGIGRIGIAVGVTGLIGIGVAAALAFTSSDSGSDRSPWADSTPEESSPLVVALCHGANQTWPANLDTSYFEAQFTETGGSQTIADYWRDISHGRFSIEGSIVLDVQLDVPRDDIGDRDDNDWDQCRDGLNEQYDIDWDVYSGPVAVKPQTLGRTIDAIDENDTTIRVRTEGHSVTADWPTPPFTAVVTTTGSLWLSGRTVLENVQVTAVSIDSDDTATFTVERGATGGYRDRTSTPTAFPANTRIRDVSEIVGSTGQLSISAHQAPSVFNHELGHFFGWNHSRLRSSATSDYGDCFDIMSAMSCANTHYFEMSTDYAGREIEATHGLGMTSIYLDQRGWIDDADGETFRCGAAATYQLRALGLPGSGLHQVRVPISTSISSGVRSEYLTVELRSRQFAWDRGIPADAVVVHLRGDDGYAYLIDDESAGGVDGLTAGDSYEIGGSGPESGDGWIIVVDEMAADAGTAEVSVTAPELFAAQPCAGGGSDDDEPTPSTPAESTTTTTEPPTTTTTEPEPDLLTGAACVPGSWELDSAAFIDALAVAVGAPSGEMQHGGGPYIITIDEDGTYSAQRDGWGFRFESPEGTLETIFDSDESGSMTWDDNGIVTFVETDTTSVTDLTIRIEIGGVLQELPMAALPAPLLAQIPEPELMSGSGTYTCEGDSLSLISDDSGVPANWTRIG